MHRTVQFKSDMEDEWEFDEDGTPTAPGSRDLATQIAASLIVETSQVSAVRQHSYYGWSFDACFQHAAYFHVLNPAQEECFLTISRRDWRRLLLLRKQRRRVLNRYCEVVDAALRRLPQISGIEWDAQSS